MRAGVITYDFFPLIGGIGRLTYTLYCELKGNDVLFFSPAANSLPGHIRIISPLVRLFRQFGVSIWLHYNVKHIISEHKLTKLNIHSGAGGVLFFKRINIPVIITCHHTYWQHYQYIKSQFWKRIFYPFEKRTYQRADKIISDCDDTTQVLIEHYDVPKEKITVIPCAVDTTKFNCTNQERKPHSIFYIGRIDTRKGVDFLIRSMSLVVQQIPDALLLIGGSGGHLDKMKALAGRLDLSRNVSFLGFVPDDQLNSLYNQSQCVVVPSIFEGFGITVIEAIATGARVVGTDVDGIRSTINSGDYGTLVPYGDCNAMADALIAELNNPRRPQELGAEYRLDQFGRRYCEVLEETAH